MSVCMLSGHRRLPAAGAMLRHRLDVHIDELCRRGVCEFLSGGALGFDLLGAEAVLAARERFPDIALTMMLPCRDQPLHYSPVQKLRYDSIVGRAQNVVVLSERYYSGCMLARNRAMAERADVCLCYLTSQQGGTAYTVSLARQKGILVINLACEL